jgi:hypothetical protein
MKAKVFKSLLFNRNIDPKEKDYWSFVVAEILYRLEDKNVKECCCIEHTAQRNKLKDALEKTMKLLR